MCARISIYTCIHTCVHVQKHTCTKASAYIDICTYTQHHAHAECTYMLTNMRLYTLTHRCIRTHLLKYIYTYIRHLSIYLSICLSVYVYAFKIIHVHTHICIYICTSCTYTYACTYTFISLYVYICGCWSKQGGLPYGIAALLIHTLWNGPLIHRVWVAR